MATTSGRPNLSVVVPAFDEEQRLGETLHEIAAYLDAQRVDAELIVVDDGSSDRTADVAREVLRSRRGRVLGSKENRGKGHAVRRGLLAAAGRWGLICDADLSTPIDQYPRLAQAARDLDLDLVIGSRALSGSHIELHQGALREASGKLFNLLVRLITGLPHRDTQCGFKLLDLSRLRPLIERLAIDRFAFDVELLFLCQRFKLSVGEVPVVWRNEPMSHVRPWVDGPRALADLLRIRWRFRRGLYLPTGGRS